jgi:flavin-dependent dehydrogenase
MDRLVADIRWYRDDTVRASSEGALVEAISDGWWYSASLPGGSAVAMLMTDADLHASRSWEQRLEEARATNSRLATWTPTGEIAKRAAHSQLATTIARDGCVAAGDAAATFDPISSLGIGFALRSGCEAARIAAATAFGETPDEGGYEASTRAIFRQYRQRQQLIYQQELRWIESEFWRRRQSTLTTGNPAIALRDNQTSRTPS